MHVLTIIITWTFLAEFNEMFYSMHVLTIIVACTFLAELEVQENKFGSYIRTGVVEDSQGSYNHEEDIRGMHVNMGNVETESNGRRGGQELVTIRSLHKKVQSYREDNENIIKYLEEILHSLNMFHRKVNKYYGTKKVFIARQVTTFRSQSKRDNTGNGKQSRSMSRRNHSPRKSNRRTYESYSKTLSKGI
jgi:hypothetical protein